jgi:DedD protein
MPQNEAEALQDGQLELKKRSRRRLVGAAALALLAAIVLPMVMDEEPRQPVQDLQIKIPSQDAPGVAARILPGRPQPTPMPDQETAKIAEPSAEKPPAEKGPAVVAAPVPPPTEAPATKTPVKADKPVDKAAEKQADKSAEKPTEKPADKQTAKSDAARATAALNGQPVDEQWVVQLGAYKEAANVKQLTAKLKQMGLPSFTEHFDSPQGTRTRVRAGPFKSREAADKALARIKKIGVDGQVAQSK